jgi:hypothetical protein
MPEGLLQGAGAKDLSQALAAFDRLAEESPANRLLRDMGAPEEKETPPEPLEKSGENGGENGADEAEAGERTQKPR